jgi:hypothetical protein
VATGAGGGGARVRKRRKQKLRWFGNLLLLLGALAMLYVALPSSGMSIASPATTDEVTIVDAQLAGRDLSTADEDDPLKITEEPNTPFSMKLKNNTDRPVEVWFTRFVGRSLAMAFLHYDLRMPLTIPPGGTRSVNTTVDFLDVSSSADGYLDAALRVYDVDKRAVSEQKFVADVQGKTTSQTGLVALELLVLAAICIIEIIVRIFRNSLPRNRFLRGLMFAFTGAVIMLSITLGLSVMRIALLPARTWVPLVLFSTLVGFVLGYLAPGPAPSNADEESRATLDLTAEEIVARASGQHDVGDGEAEGAFASGDHAAVSLASHDSGSHDSGAFGHHDSGSHGSLGHHDSGSHDLGTTGSRDATDA